VSDHTSERIPWIVTDIVLGGGKDTHNRFHGMVRRQAQIWEFVNVTSTAEVVDSRLKVLCHGPQVVLVPKNVVEEDWAASAETLLSHWLPLGLSENLTRLSETGLSLWERPNSPVTPLG
jgi:citrate lyase beta subunit